MEIFFFRYSGTFKCGELNNWAKPRVISTAPGAVFYTSEQTFAFCDCDAGTSEGLLVQ